MKQTGSTPFRVVIVGGGVAGLEAALALHELAAERVATTLLSPWPEFVDRPMRVLEPFAGSAARRYSLEEISRDIGFTLVTDAFKWLDPDRRQVHTEASATLDYDTLLLAPGATLRPYFDHALTLDDSRLDEQLHGLIQDVDGGYVHKLAFLAPSPMPWPLPLYELALLTARRAYEMNVDVSVTLATPEDAPLAVFGTQASETVERLLEDHGILTLTSTYCETPEPNQVVVHPGSRRLHVDRIVALPRLVGPALSGVPGTSAGGFIGVDAHCRLPALERVYAAGDVTDFPIKHGGIAAQQADVAAQAIAALAGAAIRPEPFHPVIRGVLLGGEKPLYLSAHVTGGHGLTSEVAETPTWSPESKIAARYLGPYLESLNQVAMR
jgi:sulfide:quinone oxidoreductase